jgi:heme exporter protein D
MIAALLLVVVIVRVVAVLERRAYLRGELEGRR